MECHQSQSRLQSPALQNTVYPKKYAHGFCFAVLCCGYTLTDFPISIRLTSLALWQSNDCPSASKATLMNMDKYFIWIHYERLHKHNKAKHNKTVCIFLGIYCSNRVDSGMVSAAASLNRGPSSSRRMLAPLNQDDLDSSIDSHVHTHQNTHQKDCFTDPPYQKNCFAEPQNQKDCFTAPQNNFSGPTQASNIDSQNMKSVQIGAKFALSLGPWPLSSDPDPLYGEHFCQ